MQRGTPPAIRARRRRNSLAFRRLTLTLPSGRHRPVHEGARCCRPNLRRLRLCCQDSAQVFAMHLVFELHHYLREHAERSRLSDRWKRRVRDVGTCDLSGSCVFSSGHSDYPEKEQANRRTLSDKQLYSLTTPPDVTGASESR